MSTGETNRGVRVVGATKVYTGLNGEPVQALRGISLAVEPGQFVSIVGRSGCGKSTLLRMIAGLETVSGGSVTVDGIPVREPPAQVRYVFQDYAQSLLPWKTVAGNVAFGLKHAAPGGQSRVWSIKDLLELVGLGHAINRYPSELSGGMQQRLAIVRALAAGPSILLMDEPFSAVDALSRANLQDMLLQVWRRFNLTILFVTHDVEEAIYLSDRIIVLGPDGRGIQSAADINLLRPRNQVVTRELEGFLKLRRQILARVLEEAEGLAA